MPISVGISRDIKRDDAVRHLARADRAGVPTETAFAIALTYRFCTFYLPPIWGLRSYRWMTRHRYL